MNYKQAANQMASYVLSENHEWDSYIEMCRGNGDNPLLIEENPHVFAAAAFVRWDGKMDQWRKENFQEDDIELLDQCDCLLKRPSMVESYPELLDEIREEIEVVEAEAQDFGDGVVDEVVIKAKKMISKITK